MLWSLNAARRSHLILPVSVQLCDLLHYAGYNIHVGKDFYANFACTILDCGRVDIGDRVLLGPNCQIYTGRLLLPTSSVLLLLLCTSMGSFFCAPQVGSFCFCAPQVGFLGRSAACSLLQLQAGRAVGCF